MLTQRVTVVKREASGDRHESGCTHHQSAPDRRHLPGRCVWTSCSQNTYCARALGVSIGIAALVGVLGLSESSKSALLDEIASLGTNLLTIEAGAGFGGGDSALPEDALATVERVPTVTDASAVWAVDANVYRNEFIPEGETGSIQVVASDEGLLDTLNGELADGVFLDRGTSSYPNAVVGSVAAERLGIDGLDRPTYVFIGDDYVEVIGVLEEFPLAADLDRAVIIGKEAAVKFYDADERPAVLYSWVVDGSIDETRDILLRPLTQRTPRRSV